jgi:catechol 2,3-dioxygenase-like lactoylglutathione lyase family enzyme
MAIDHFSIGVRDVRRAKNFYDAVLKPLGIEATHVVEDRGQVFAVRYGVDFWIQLPFNKQLASMGNGVHVAFHAPSRAAVDEFYLAALEKGGAEDGRPGLRSEYHPDYYGAFVRDPDGNKIEACIHTPV